SSPTCAPPGDTCTTRRPGATTATCPKSLHAEGKGARRAAAGDFPFRALEFRLDCANLRGNHRVFLQDGVIMKPVLATLLIACFTASAGIATIGCSGDTRKKDDSDKPTPGEPDAVVGRPEEASGVTAVEKLGGRVKVDAERPGKPVVAVNLNYTRVTDAGLKELNEFQSLQTLTRFSTHVTDAGLKVMKELKNLQTLDLFDTKVTDAGLKELKELKCLKNLSLNSTQSTDAGLKELKELKSLQSLLLANTAVTDAGLMELKELQSLQELDLGRTAVTDTGLMELKELKNLQYLILQR